jgi:BirA family biotin operon repressor/biotin-[acetyl-CoA-carboxylase] ligase
VPPDAVAPFDLERIVAETWVQQVQYHESVDSTNTTALAACLQENLDTPLLVLAAQQTAGRGRGSHQWWSATGSLTFSLVINPSDLEIEPRDWPKASLTTGLALCLALDELLESPALTLKWPNDVFLDRRKISGVLLEGTAGRLVIGIGINVNCSFQDAPAPLPSTATSLFDATGKNFSLDDVLIRILQQLDQQLRRLACNDTTLLTDWQQRCQLTGRRLEVSTENRQVTGVCQGIDQHGALVLMTETGLVPVVSGTITELE